jgi:hypothetical protein
MNVLLWLLYFIPALAIELVCYLLAPIVACFVRSELRHDYVKRLGLQQLMPRDYLVKPLYWFQTHDNAVDEWWYGVYNTDHWFAFARAWTQTDYDRSALIRYYCRLMWLWRNCAYGFHYALFSRPKETASRVYSKGVEGVGFWYELKLFKSSFQFECQMPLGARYLTINIGWKAHKQTDRLLYANRIIGFRKYK